MVSWQLLTILSDSSCSCLMDLIFCSNFSTFSWHAVSSSGSNLFITRLTVSSVYLLMSLILDDLLFGVKFPQKCFPSFVQ